MIFVHVSDFSKHKTAQKTFWVNLTLNALGGFTSSNVTINFILLNVNNTVELWWGQKWPQVLINRYTFFIKFCHKVPRFQTLVLNILLNYNRYTLLRFYQHIWFKWPKTSALINLFSFPLRQKPLKAVKKLHIMK